VLHQGVKGIAELITVPGLINVDFADVKTIMNNAGTALMGVGIGSGDKRAIAAIKQAISSPLLDVSIEGSKGVLFNIVGGPDLTMSEVDEAASVITSTVDPDADIIFGAVIDDKMLDQVKVSLIATKFDEGKLKLFRFRQDDLAEEVGRETDKFAPEEIDGDLKKKPAKKLREKEVEDLVEDEEIVTDDEEESEFDIPAFLRKK
jgi:cell division protein FtsZ